MNLIVDIGNTLSKLAIVEGEKIVKMERYELVSQPIVKDFISHYQPSQAIVSTVGAIDEHLMPELQAMLPCLELNQSTPIPIKNRYKTPQTLGYDRLAVVTGANYLYPLRDILVIDCGTAITYDIITHQQEYIGGAISPGINLRFKALNTFTSKLPLLQSDDNFPLIGSDTNECILSGVQNGLIAEVDYFITQLKCEYPNLLVLFTGGDANFFVNKLKNSIFVIQNLVVIGLSRILDYNS